LKTSLDQAEKSIKKKMERLETRQINAQTAARVHRMKLKKKFFLRSSLVNIIRFDSVQYVVINGYLKLLLANNVWPKVLSCYQRHGQEQVNALHQSPGDSEVRVS